MPGLLRNRASRRSCRLHGDNGCENRGQAGPRARAQDNRAWRRAELEIAGSKSMTHEHKANAEHPDGPEHDHSLPDADRIPGGLSPDESDLPALEADL